MSLRDGPGDTAEPDGQKLSAFLKSASFRRRKVVEAQSAKTTPYDTFAMGLEWPFHLVVENQMAALITSDLFDRVLPNTPLTNASNIEEAKSQHDSYNKNLAKNFIDDEASVWLSTHSVLNTCIKCLESVGENYILKTEHRNATANVAMDSAVLGILYTDNCKYQFVQHGGIAVEDKSPKVYKAHCEDGEVKKVCGDLTVDAREDGFRAIILKVRYR